MYYLHTVADLVQVSPHALHGGSNAAPSKNHAPKPFPHFAVDGSSAYRKVTDWSDRSGARQGQWHSGTSMEPERTTSSATSDLRSGVIEPSVNDIAGCIRSRR